MDPNTYKVTRYADDENLHREDMERVAAALKTFTVSGQPGVALLFVYAMHPEERPKFWCFVDELAAETGTRVDSGWLVHQGGNRNLVGLLRSAVGIPKPRPPFGVNSGR
jgi:hypothetical protein